MKKTTKYFIFILATTYLNANDIEILVHKLNIQPGSKAILQWDRVFKSERKMKKYKMNSLTLEDKQRLEVYLKNHAIDSDKPTVAGEI